jgi:hypothetical protein
MCCQTLYCAVHIVGSTVKFEVGFKTLQTFYNAYKIILIKPQGNTTVEDKLVIRNRFRRESVNWIQLAQDSLQ